MPFPLHLPPISGSKSLTPQRKHRKLLKDGSGAEVWPESVEKIFVQGPFFSSFLLDPHLFPKVYRITGVPPTQHTPSPAAGAVGATSSS